MSNVPLPEPDYQFVIGGQAINIHSIEDAPCVSGDRYQALPLVRLWRKA